MNLPFHTDRTLRQERNAEVAVAALRAMHDTLCFATVANAATKHQWGPGWRCKVCGHQLPPIELKSKP